MPVFVKVCMSSSSLLVLGKAPSWNRGLYFLIRQRSFKFKKKLPAGGALVALIDHELEKCRCRLSVI
jgi:hypothetical protein